MKKDPAVLASFAKHSAIQITNLFSTIKHSFTNSAPNQSSKVKQARIDGDRNLTIIN